MILVQCVECSKEFKTTPSRIKNGRKFCSRKCYFKWRSENLIGNKSARYTSVPYNCDMCGKETSIQLNRLKSHKHLFCSTKCKIDYFKGPKILNWKRKVNCKCFGCDTNFEVTPAIVKRGGGKFCSIKCMFDFWRKNPSNRPNWKGGIAHLPYCEKFNFEFKERVREFFNRKCFICGKSEKENGKCLNVHHVGYNKETCCDNSIPLFVILCKSCHSKTNSNEREKWQSYFTNRLINEYDGKCFYTKEEMNAKRKKS